MGTTSTPTIAAVLTNLAGREVVGIRETSGAVVIVRNQADLSRLARRYVTGNYANGAVLGQALRLLTTLNRTVAAEIAADEAWAEAEEEAAEGYRAWQAEQDAMRRSSDTEYAIELANDAWAFWAYGNESLFG